MNLTKLISILSKQLSNLESLLKIVNDKKEALVNNSYETLNKVVAAEEQKLLTVQLAEEERLSVMQKLFVEFNIKSERFKLKNLVDGLKDKAKPDIVKNISDFEEKIKSTIGEISRVNNLNMILIQQSKSLISQTIQAIVSSGNKSILDRKG